MEKTYPWLGTGEGSASRLCQCDDGGEMPTDFNEVVSVT